MQKIFSSIFVVVSLCASLHADELELGEGGFPFDGKKVELVWNVSTNRLPLRLNIYQVVPAKFSLEQISNAVALGEFKEPSKVRNALAPALKGKDSSFEEEPAHKAISISPARGTISLINTKPIALPGQPIAAIPSEDDVLRLTLDIARKLGIPSSAIARKPDTDTFLCWRDRRLRSGQFDGKYDKRDIARGIFLYRAIDGVSFDGTGVCGGLYVNFGNFSRVAEIDLSWRNLQLKKTCSVATHDELAKRIKRGEALIQIDPNDGDPTAIKRLTITNLTAHYRGHNSSHVQKTVYPFAKIEATAELEGKKVPVLLLCPIIQE